MTGQEQNWRRQYLNKPRGWRWMARTWPLRVAKERFETPSRGPVN